MLILKRARCAMLMRHSICLVCDCSDETVLQDLDRKVRVLAHLLFLGLVVF